MNVWNAKRKIMQRYNITANMYNMRYEKEQTHKITALFKELPIPEHSLILDVGCGTGLLFQHVSNKTNRIIGLDVSKQVLRQAKRETQKRQNIHLILADADNIPLQQNVSKYVFAITLLQNMPHPIQTLKEMRRAATTNAVIMVTSLKKILPLEEFMTTLQKAGLHIEKIVSNVLQCYIAVCIEKKETH